MGSRNAEVAQLVEASGLEPEQYGFESLLRYQICDGGGMIDAPASEDGESLASSCVGLNPTLRTIKEKYELQTISQRITRQY